MPLPLDELKIPVEPPQGRPAKKVPHNIYGDMSKMPFFSEYIQRYYADGPMRCASGAWGLILPYMLAEEGKSAVVFPVSTWKLKDYVKKPGVSSVVSDLNAKITTNADLHNILSDADGKLKPGTVITLDSGHSYEGKRRGDPSHTMVYSKYGLWLDNRTNQEITFNYFGGAPSNTPADLERNVRRFGQQISSEEIKSLANDGDWLKKGQVYISRENGKYYIHDYTVQYMFFTREKGTVQSKPGSQISASGIGRAIGDASAIITDRDVQAANGLKEGGCHYIYTEASRFIFSNLDPDAREKSAAMFGIGVFQGSDGKKEFSARGSDGKRYVIRREFDETGKREALNVYLAPSNVVCYILKRSGDRLEVSAKRNDFIENFTWAKNSGLYSMDFSKMPPSTERQVSSRDFGLEKVTAEGFASLLSKTYGIMFEYALNEILKQNKVATPRTFAPSLDVQIAVMLPEAKIGRILSLPIQLIETPSERAYWKNVKETPEYTPSMGGPPIPSQNKMIAERRDEYFRRCAEIDNFFHSMGVRSTNVDALKIVMYNEMFSSSSGSTPIFRYSGSYSWREFKKHLSRSLLGINSIDSWGAFQQNMSYVTRYLEGWPLDKLYAPESSKFANQKIGAARRKELFERIRHSGWFKNRTSDTSPDVMLGWGSLDAKERRSAVADMMESCTPFSLFAANLLYEENKRCFTEQAARVAGRNYSAIDLELTCVLAHNRGLGRANLAIFQQNLLIVASNLSRQPGARAELAKAVKKFRVDGYLGEDTLGLVKLVCAAKGIASVRFSSREIPVSSLTVDAIGQNLIESESRYKNAFSFFSSKGFSDSDFATKKDPKNTAPYPMLKYTFANSSEHNKNFTQYVRDFCFFTEPLDKASESLSPKQSLDARVSEKKIAIKYSIPAYPGLVSINVKSASGAKKPYEYVFMDAARQRSGSYFLETGNLPTGQAYVVELNVGDNAMQRAVFMPK